MVDKSNIYNGPSNNFEHGCDASSAGAYTVKSRPRTGHKPPLRETILLSLLTRAHYTRRMAEALAALYHGSSGSGSGVSADHHNNNNGGVKAPPLLQGNQWK
jgi:hypothetical protein